MNIIFKTVNDLLNNWDDPQTITGMVIVAIAGIVIRYFEKRKLIKKLKK